MDAYSLVLHTHDCAWFIVIIKRIFYYMRIVIVEGVFMVISTIKYLDAFNITRGGKRETVEPNNIH